MLRTFKIRLYPNKSQRNIFENGFGVRRWAYNWALDEELKYWKTKKINIEQIYTEK